MRYRYYLDGGLVTEPEGSDGLTTQIKRDDVANGIIVTQDAPITFIEDGYDYLWDLLNNNSFCSSAALKILASEDEGANYVDYFTGNIFISDVRFDEQTKRAKAKVQDNSFDAKINNNKNVKALIHVGRSKTDVTIDPAPYVTVTLFDVATGTDIAVTAGSGNEAQGRMYRIYDVLRFFIDYMADGQIGFESSIFDTGGEFEGLCISSGYMVKGYDGTTPENTFYDLFPKISYADVINNLKPLNLYFQIENPDTSPVLRLERKSYFENSAVLTAQIASADKIETYIATELLYSSVKFGSGGLTYDSAYDYPERINMVGFNEEQFHTVGTCNIDNTLDLSIEWTISSNAIQEAIDRANLSSMEDDAIVMINCTPVISGSTYAATKNNWLSGGSSPLFYNEALNNYNTSLRYLGAIPNSIALFLGDATNEFLAVSTLDSNYNSPSDTREPVLFEDDFTPPYFDDNNNYDASQSEYTAPSTGVYTFNINLDMYTNHAAILFGSAYSFVTFYPKINIYDTGFGGTLLRTINLYSGTTGYGFNFSSESPKVFNITTSGTFNMDATEVAVLSIYVLGQFGGYKVRQGSTFGVSSAVTGGGSFQTYNPDDYPVLRHEIEAPITFTQFQAIKANPKGALGFAMSGDAGRRGFISSFKHNNHSAKMILYSSKNLNR